MSSEIKLVHIEGEVCGVAGFLARDDLENTLVTLLNWNPFSQRWRARVHRTAEIIDVKNDKIVNSFHAELYYAMRREDTRARVGSLLGAVVGRPSSGNAINAPHPVTRLTPLMYAVRLGDPTLVRVLLRRGADPNSMAPYSLCYIHESGAPYNDAAESASEMDTVASARGYQLHTGKCRSVLMYAACVGNVAIAELLLGAGAAAGAAQSALLRAVYHGHLVTVRLLLCHRADPNERSPNDDLSHALNAAMHSPQLGRAKATAMLELLLLHGASPDAMSRWADQTQLTPLVWAAWRCKAREVRILLEHGADVTFRATRLGKPKFTAREAAMQFVTERFEQHAKETDMHPTEGNRAYFELHCGYPKGVYLLPARLKLVEQGYPRRWIANEEWCPYGEPRAVARVVLLVNMRAGSERLPWVALPMDVLREHLLMPLMWRWLWDTTELHAETDPRLGGDA